ncbi:MAG: hypothetical protein HXO52_04525 [Prevotella sp.]|jgi:hypothetical protein|uniref:Uncharacterized protein n=1 Tax=Prevotella vespertina TaxID=2608404 RepID=A0A7C9LAX9_9BACT|nr:MULTISPECIES: hypothetical protein [Prevotella]EID34385.1 hypothetical protein HMPREF9969_1297 [Prevotella sp. oral taxon 306 str. F0472]MBF1626459.1 hypothetical protein [Prevotella sp.]MBF1627568.1 hypothetical protein [Prevotella sp.]MBF1631489.1 hypothetical protein [Prevotella sp.]MBF1638079.1 hypothetical protein [Prevotella sp.]
MTTPMIGLVALLAIALIAWAIAELKNRSITFTHSEAEAEGEEEMREAYEANGNKELNLKDLLARNSTKGYKSI